jgi:ectoine hydroxylase-related dioxygenase (phytanoyl-CoA dioxygenase family)
MVREAELEEAPAVDLVDDKRYQELLGSTVKWEWRPGAPEIRSMEPYHHLHPQLDALIDDPRLWGPTRALVGSEAVSLFSDKLNFKRPGGAPFPWHQDTPYWAFGCDHLDRLVSVMLYLDEANRENGCLWVIPDSQRQGVIPCQEDRGVLGHLYTDVERVVAGEPTALEIPAGSVIFFHGNLVHGSQTNRSDCSRRALVLTYQPADLPRWQHDDVRPVEVTPQ